MSEIAMISESFHIM